MSLYNLLNGMNADLVAAASVVLGFRIDEKFPRFRNIFTGADDSDIKADLFVYTRMGGGNRKCWGQDDSPRTEQGDCGCFGCSAERLEAEPWCCGRYDDDFDSTYSTFAIKFTDDQRAEWAKLQAGDPPPDFEERMRGMFPKLFEGAKEEEGVTT